MDISEIITFPKDYLKIIHLQFRMPPSVFGEICSVYCPWYSATVWWSVPCFHQPVTEFLIQTNKAKGHVQTNQTYFASCLLDRRLLLLVGIVPWCGWSFSSEKKMSFSLRSVAWGLRRHLFFSFSSCGIKILRDSRRQWGQEKVQKQRVALKSFSGFQEPEVMQHLGNCQVKYSTHNCKSLTFWLHCSGVRSMGASVVVREWRLLCEANKEEAKKLIILPHRTNQSQPTLSQHSWTSTKPIRTQPTHWQTSQLVISDQYIYQHACQSRNLECWKDFN